MGNCVCMHDLANCSKNKKWVASSGGDSVKPFLEAGTSVHPLTVDGTEEEEKALATGGSKVVRLKVVLTKAEAAQLLASGAVVTTPEKASPAMSVLEQLAAELERLGSTEGTHSQPNGCGSCAWKPALESIPEVI